MKTETLKEKTIRFKKEDENYEKLRITKQSIFALYYKMKIRNLTNCKVKLVITTNESTLNNFELDLKYNGFRVGGELKRMKNTQFITINENCSRFKDNIEFTNIKKRCCYISIYLIDPKEYVSNNHDKWLEIRYNTPFDAKKYDLDILRKWNSFIFPRNYDVNNNKCSSRKSWSY